GWRGLGDWNQTSSTLGRAPDGRIRWGNAFGQSESRSRHDHFGNAFRIGRNVIASARIKRRSRRHHNRPPAAYKLESTHLTGSETCAACAVSAQNGHECLRSTQGTRRNFFEALPWSAPIDRLPNN